MPAAPVHTALVIQKEVQPYVRLIGTTRAFRQSLVASEVEGKVIEFGARRGARVRENGLLARIDQNALAIDLEVAGAQLGEAEMNRENARLELERREVLFRQKSISNREYDEARLQAAAQESRIRALEARIKAIEYDIRRCIVRAPFAGYVVEEYTEVGQWAGKGGAIAEMVDIDPIVVTVPVPDRYVRFVGPGQTLKVLFQALGEDGTLEGTVRAVIRKGNESARTFPLEIIVPNPDGLLLAGMSCEVRFPVGAAEEHILVHKDAVVAGSDEYHVFAVRDGSAVLVPVEKGLAYDGHVVVHGDVRQGEPVVIEGNERLQPDQEVRVLD